MANLSIATDESYIDKNSGSGDRVDKTEWHRVVTFQPGLVDMLTKNARKGWLVYGAGKMQTRRWRKDGEDSDRFSTEILLAPGGRVQDDILNPGGRYYVIHLDEDRCGPVCVHERSRIREVAERLVETHPLW